MTSCDAGIQVFLEHLITSFATRADCLAGNHAKTILSKSLVGERIRTFMYVDDIHQHADNRSEQHTQESLKVNHTMSHETSNEEAADNSVAARIKIDYEELMADTEPDQPEAVSSGPQMTTRPKKKRSAGLEAFINKIMEAPYEEE